VNTLEKRKGEEMDSEYKKLREVAGRDYHNATPEEQETIAQTIADLRHHKCASFDKLLEAATTFADTMECYVVVEGMVELAFEDFDKVVSAVQKIGGNEAC
jgi:hypothetical protein